MIAARVASMINDLGFWCTESCGLNHYKSVQVNWVGLFDACARMRHGGNWPSAVPHNVAHFDHAIKTKQTGAMRLFPTWHFTGSNERAFNQYNGSLTTHRDIGESKILGNNDSYNWIKNQAISAGVAF
jgi:hypothetical protein